MKLSIVILVVLLSACTSINYTSPDGRSFSYWSSKDVKANLVKDGDNFSITVEAQNEVKEFASGLAQGIVKGLAKP